MPRKKRGKGTKRTGGKKMQAAQPLDLTAELAEVLRWREMEWSRIPPLSRKLAIPYLTAGDTINLDTAVTNKEDRKHLVKAYVGLRSAGLDGYAHYRVDDDGVCLGVKWAQKRSIDLRNFRLEYKYAKKNQDWMLAHLVFNKKKELATYFATRCDVRDAECNVMDNSSTLMMASEHGYLEIVQTLLGRGADVHHSNEYDDIALHKASEKGHLEVVRALLGAGAGADVRRLNDEGYTPISYACKGKHIQVLRALVEAGGDVNTPDSGGCTALHDAALAHGFTEGVRYLLERGADVNMSTTDGNGDTPLSFASISGKVEVVRAQLEAGADVHKSNDDGDTALHKVSRNGNIEVVRTLLEAGAGADVRRFNENDVETPISYACKGKHMEVFRALVEAGGDVNTPDSFGNTALYNASECGFTEGVRYLVERGADVNRSCTNEDGDTPLTMASGCGHLEVVRALLEAGADVNKRDRNGDNPLYYALKEDIRHSEQRRQDRAQVAALLREAGAQEPHQP